MYRTMQGLIVQVNSQLEEHGKWDDFKLWAQLLPEMYDTRSND